MELSEFINSLAPIEGIPLDIYRDIWNKSTQLIVCKQLGFKCRYCDGHNTYPVMVKCIREYYTDDPDGKKKIGAKDCMKILQSLFDRSEIAHIYPNCVNCHSQCFKKKEKGELFFLNKKPRAEKTIKRRKNQ